MVIVSTAMSNDFALGYSRMLEITRKIQPSLKSNVRSESSRSSSKGLEAGLTTQKTPLRVIVSSEMKTSCSEKLSVSQMRLACLAHKNIPSHRVEIVKETNSGSTVMLRGNKRSNFFHSSFLVERNDPRLLTAPSAKTDSWWKRAA